MPNFGALLPLEDPTPPPGIGNVEEYLNRFQIGVDASDPIANAGMTLVNKIAFYGMIASFGVFVIGLVAIIVMSVFFSDANRKIPVRISIIALVVGCILAAAKVLFIFWLKIPFFTVS